MGLPLHLTAHLDIFARYVPQTERSHCIFSPVLSLSLFAMTKYSFRKGLASINSCTTAMGQAGTESGGQDTSSQEPLGPRLGSCGRDPQQLSSLVV